MPGWHELCLRLGKLKAGRSPGRIGGEKDRHDDGRGRSEAEHEDVESKALHRLGDASFTHWCQGGQREREQHGPYRSRQSDRGRTGHPEREHLNGTEPEGLQARIRLRFEKALA